MQHLKCKLTDALTAVIPITVIVLLLSITVAPLSSGVMVLFVFGAMMLVIGMGLFTLGSEMSMEPMGEGIGIQISKSKHLAVPLILCFIIGALITVAEPDLTVLADQISSIPNNVLIFSVAVGVGLFLVVALLRVFFHVKLSRLLMIFYLGVFVISAFAPRDFIPAAFDSGGVTTGPITVPFIMALGIGMASIRSDKKSEEESFGLVALCSIGPIASVLILSICFSPDATASETVLYDILTTKDAIKIFMTSIPRYAVEVFVALVPLVGVFALFQIVSKRFKKRQILRIISGFMYTYIGLVLFLTGANVGFMPAGHVIGKEIGESRAPALLIPIGMLVGYFIVAAEPAVQVLKKQVEEISNGRISQKAMGLGLSVGVALSVGISMIRILTEISIFWFLIPGYAISLIISFFVPPIYTGVAFDSGGVASGPMATAFLLPLAMGACDSIGGNILTDAFGIVAMVAMTPLITIQLLGLVSEIKARRTRKMAIERLESLEDCIIYFDREEEMV